MRENKIKFENLNISNELKKSLKLLGFEYLTRVQEEAISKILNGEDLIIKSQTGSGKTASFCIPLIENTEFNSKSYTLILSPTRELVLQIKEELDNFSKFKTLRSVAIYGKDSFDKQKLMLKQSTQFVVATPGRLLDHLYKGNIKLKNVKALVIDEADLMLSMGFIDQVNEIISALPENRQNILLSATLQSDLDDILSIMNSPTLVEVEDEFDHKLNINKEFYNLENDELLIIKDILMLKLAKSALIFCNTVADVDRICDYLLRKNLSVNKIHGQMRQLDRTKVINDFKEKRFRYLVATDVASRGLDIDSLELIINYELPRLKEQFIHRIGRTARIGKNGSVVTLVNKQNLNRLEILKEYIQEDIELLDFNKDKALKNSESFKKLSSTREKILKKNLSINKDTLLLHINAGKDKKIRNIDIVGTIYSIENITKEDIGVINVYKDFSTVEILNNKGNSVLKELNNKTIKAKKRKVTVLRKSL